MCPHCAALDCFFIFRKAAALLVSVESVESVVKQELLSVGILAGRLYLAFCKS